MEECRVLWHLRYRRRPNMYPSVSQFSAGPPQSAGSGSYYPTVGQVSQGSSGVNGPSAYASGPAASGSPTQNFPLLRVQIAEQFRTLPPVHPSFPQFHERAAYLRLSFVVPHLARWQVFKLFCVFLLFCTLPLMHTWLLLFLRCSCAVMSLTLVAPTLIACFLSTECCSLDLCSRSYNQA